MRKKYIIDFHWGKKNGALHGNVENPPIKSGGRFALLSLYRDLKYLGEKVYLSDPHQNKNKKGLLYDFNIEYEFFNPKNDINDYVVIYPEVEQGNPLGAKNVIRWFLHYPTFHGKKTNHWNKENELYFSFSGWQDFESKKRKFNTQGILTCLHTDLETFKDYNKKREGSCYIRRKNLNRNFNKDLIPKNSVYVEEILNSSNKRDIADCLNSYEYFYSYDENTYFSVLAALCGCVSVVVTDNEDQKSWYKNKPLYYKDAVAYGGENIDHVKKNMHLIKAGVMTSKKQNLKTVENFIKITQERFRK